VPQPFLFTTHARERLQLRSISIDAAESVLRNPDKTFPGQKPGTTKFIRTLGGREVQLIATYLADKKQWLVVSAWVRGEEDPVPFVWQVITLPFKLSWWLIKKIFFSAKNSRNT
jgi:hypothetical protein